MERKEILKFFGLTLLSIPVGTLIIWIGSLINPRIMEWMLESFPYYLLVLWVAPFLFYLPMSFSAHFREIVKLKKGLVFFTAGSITYAVLGLLIEMSLFRGLLIIFLPISGPAFLLAYIPMFPHLASTMIPLYLIGWTAIALLYCTRPRRAFYKRLKEVFIAFYWFLGTFSGFLLSAGI